MIKINFVTATQCPLTTLTDVFRTWERRQRPLGHGARSQGLTSLDPLSKASVPTCTVDPGL